MLQLLFVDLLDMIASVLQQVHQVHDLLLSVPKVLDLVIHVGASVVQLPILLHQLAHIFEYLLSALITRLIERITGALQRLRSDLLAANL